MKSAIILSVISALSSLTKSEWTLLAEEDVSSDPSVQANYFDSTIFTQPIGDEGDALFSQIANFDPEPHRDENDDLQFRIRWETTAGDQQTIEWTQSNWITDSGTPSDVNIISAVPPQTLPTTADAYFDGLALSNVPSVCFIDGNGADNGFWNCVGQVVPYDTISPPEDYGIAGYNGNIARRMQLWIDTIDATDISSAIEELCDKIEAQNERIYNIEQFLLLSHTERKSSDSSECYDDCQCDHDCLCKDTVCSMYSGLCEDQDSKDGCGELGDSCVDSTECCKKTFCVDIDPAGNRECRAVITKAKNGINYYDDNAENTEAVTYTITMSNSVQFVLYGLVAVIFGITFYKIYQNKMQK